MLEGIPVDLLDGLAVVTVVLVFGFMVARGALVTRRELDAVMHDRDEWRAESRLKDAQLAEKDKQLGALEEVGETMAAVLGSIQRLADRDGTNGR